MSRLDENAAARKARDARLAKHAAKGRTLMEACDIEGADPATVRGLKLKWDTARYRPPKGSDGDALLIHRALQRFVSDLLAKHLRYEVSTMLGMTLNELRRAERKDDEGPHGWTLAQINRLAKVYNVRLGDLLDEASMNLKRDGKEKYVYPRQW
jgi:hypothetical protein